MVLLELGFPPSLNTYYRNVNGRMIMSRAGREYREDVAARVALAYGPNPPALSGRLTVMLLLHNSANRKYDIDNRPKAVLDSLEKSGVFADDGQIDQLVVFRGQKAEGGSCWVMITEHDGSHGAAEEAVRQVCRVLMERGSVLMASQQEGGGDAE